MPSKAKPQPQPKANKRAKGLSTGTLGKGPKLKAGGVHTGALEEKEKPKGEPDEKPATATVRGSTKGMKSALDGLQVTDRSGKTWKLRLL